MRLVLPDKAYKDTFLKMVRDLSEEGTWHDVDPATIEGNFNGYLKSLQEATEGRGLPDGYVPCTDYWVLGGANTDVVVGRLMLRHKLNPFLASLGGHIGYQIKRSERNKGYGTFALNEGLKKAAKLGISQVLVTCNDDNFGSIKIIEKNGGSLQDKVQNAGRLVPTRRYWIQTS